MDATLKGLADLLLQAVPTILFFIFLTVFLKYMYFRPMAKLQEERRRATEGVRDLAQRAREAADQKSSEFERALEIARGDLQKEHDELRRHWYEEQARAIQEARAAADERLTQAKHEITQDSETAQTQLDANVESLSEQIVQSLLERRAA